MNFEYQGGSSVRAIFWHRRPQTRKGGALAAAGLKTGQTWSVSHCLRRQEGKMADLGDLWEQGAKPGPDGAGEGGGGVD